MPRVFAVSQPAADPRLALCIIAEAVSVPKLLVMILPNLLAVPALTVEFSPPLTPVVSEAVAPVVVPPVSTFRTPFVVALSADVLKDAAAVNPAAVELAI